MISQLGATATLRERRQRQLPQASSTALTGHHVLRDGDAPRDEDLAAVAVATQRHCDQTVRADPRPRQTPTTDAQLHDVKGHEAEVEGPRGAAGRRLGADQRRGHKRAEKRDRGARRPRPPAARALGAQGVVRRRRTPAFTFLGRRRHFLPAQFTRDREHGTAFRHALPRKENTSATIAI